jgi:flagellar basal-body rod modification protein FlgD
MSTTPVPPPTSGTGTSGTTNGLPTGQSLNNMFLQLLVAQLQNQDPTSPVDPSQFVGQLAQFSELSEVTSIYQLMQTFAPASGSTGSGTGGTASPTGGSAGSAASSAAAVSAANAAISAGSAAADSSQPGAILPASSASPNFASPNISQLVTSKIQGAF